jgi:hypothetical protein
VHALIIQAGAALTGWPPHLAHELARKRLTDHFSAPALYALVVCVAVPTLTGLTLGTWLRNTESDGALKWWHYALGGRDSRRAWDYAFSQHGGSWLRVVLRESIAASGSDPVLRPGRDASRQGEQPGPSRPMITSLRRRVVETTDG